MTKESSAEQYELRTFVTFWVVALYYIKIGILGIVIAENETNIYIELQKNASRKTTNVEKDKELN